MEPAGRGRVERRLAAILAADVAGYCDGPGSLDTGKKFDSEGQILQNTFIERLNQTDYLNAFEATKRYIVTYDPGREKDQSPLVPDADVAQFEVKAYAVLGPSPVPVTSGQ
jgi:hypothetical protein